MMTYEDDQNEDGAPVADTENKRVPTPLQESFSSPNS